MNTNIQSWRNKLVEILRILPTSSKIELAAALVLGKIRRKDIQAALADAANTSFDKHTQPPGEPLSFYYESESGNMAQRQVIPIRIYQHTTKKKGETNWYMEAWCLQNRNFRTYRLDHLNVGLGKIGTEDTASE